MVRTTDRRRGGFTLAELVIVVAIIGLASAIVGPEIWKITQQTKLKQGGREVLSLMRSARFKAINEGRDYTVFARLDKRFQVLEGNDPLDTAAIQSDISLPGGVSFEGPNAGNPAFDGFQTNGGGAFVIFSADGSADSSGAFRLGNGNQLQYVELRLDPATTARMRLRTWKDAMWTEGG